MDLGLPSTIAGLVFSSRCSRAALLTQGSADFSWSPKSLGDGFSIPHYNEHNPAARIDMVLICMAHYLRVDLPALESLPR